MSARMGSRIGSIVGGVLSCGVPAQDAQEQEVRDADRADVDDGAGDDLVDLVADPQPGQEEAEQACGEHRRQDADECTDGSVAVARKATLAAIDATHAPTSILPSSAMLSMPLRSDRMPASAPSVIGVASSRLPANTPVRFAGLPASSVASDGRDNGTNRTMSHGRQRNAGAAPRAAARRRAPAATPAMIHSTPTVVSSWNASPPCLSIQNEKVAVTSNEPVAR